MIIWDKARDAFAGIIEHFVGARLDYLARYPATVVEQEQNGTLHLQPDDARIPGLTGIPIRKGIPGSSVTVPSGARVLVAFEGGSPRYPIAELWESGTPITVKFDASVSVQLEAPIIQLGEAALRGVARLGDTAGPYVITTASTKVLSE